MHLHTSSNELARLARLLTAEPNKPPHTDASIHPTLNTQIILFLVLFIHCRAKQAKRATTYIHPTHNIQIIHFSFFSSSAEPNEPNEPPHIYIQHLSTQIIHFSFFSSTAEPNEPPNLNAFKNGPVSCSCSLDLTYLPYEKTRVMYIIMPVRVFKRQ